MDNVEVYEPTGFSREGALAIQTQSGSLVGDHLNRGEPITFRKTALGLVRDRKHSAGG